MSPMHGRPTLRSLHEALIYIPTNSTYQAQSVNATSFLSSGFTQNSFSLQYAQHSTTLALM